MKWLRAIASMIWRFLTRRFLFVGRIVVGIFMIGVGIWFVLAPITQQFLMQQDVLQDAPFLWLIVPVGLLQISIGYSLLRPLWHSKHKSPEHE